MNFRLKELREDNNLTQKQVADILYCSQSAYSKYEKGVLYPSVDMLVKLADFYGVSINYIIGRDKQTNK